jgi:hypothetical protein
MHAEWNGKKVDDIHINLKNFNELNANQIFELNGKKTPTIDEATYNSGTISNSSGFSYGFNFLLYDIDDYIISTVASQASGNLATIEAYCTTLYDPDIQVSQATQLANCISNASSGSPSVPNTTDPAPSTTTFDLKYSMPNGSTKSIVTKTVNH